MVDGHGVEAASVDPWPDGEGGYVADLVFEHEFVEMLVDSGGVEVEWGDGVGGGEEEVLGGLNGDRGSRWGGWGCFGGWSGGEEAEGGSLEES